MNPYIEIIRPGNVVMAMIAVVLVSIVDHSLLLSTILAVLAVFFEISAGNVINDYYDYNIDLINKPQRPIPSGRISLNSAKNYAFILFLFGTICGGLITYLNNSWIPFIIVLIADVLLFFYAFKLKSTPLIGNILVAFMTGLCFAFTGYSINNQWIINISWFLGFFAFIMTFAREIVKDIEDIKGDEKEGAKTFPIIYGERISSIIAFILIILDCILCPLLYVNHIFNIKYLIIIAAGVILFIYSAVLIIKNPDELTAHKVSKYLKTGMLIAFIAFAIGTF